MSTKRLLCLANSRKLNGRCIAGREFLDGSPGAWVRPVSARANQEVSEYERQYQDGSDPTLLDVIDVPLLEPCPKGFQQENWLLDPEQYWTRVDTCSWEDLERFCEAVGPLWRNGSSTYHGANDRIPLRDAAQERSSLRLIYVESVRLQVFAPGEAFGNRKRRVQASFRFDRTYYSLWVTDPNVERPYLARADGNYSLGECYLTISLGEPFNDHCYKLVAAIVEKQKAP